MTTIVFNDTQGIDPAANSRNRIIVEEVERRFAQLGTGMAVVPTTSFAEVDSLVEKGGVTIVFTNFPLDVTEDARGEPKGSYEPSKSWLRNIAERHPDLEIVVITGASEKGLTDADIREAAPGVPVEVQRKSEWALPGIDYHRTCAAFIAKRVTDGASDRGSGSDALVKETWPADVVPSGWIVLDRPLMDHYEHLSEAKGIIFLCAETLAPNLMSHVLEGNLPYSFLDLPESDRVRRY